VTPEDFRTYDLRSPYATRLSTGALQMKWVTQLLRQGDAKVFKKYSQMKLQMKREALKKLNRKANEGQGVTWRDQTDEVLSRFATLGAFFLDLVRPDSFGNSGSGLKSQEVPFRARSSVG
jgi:hypothetical protein